jgi:hypothetical protein
MAILYFLSHSIYYSNTAERCTLPEKKRKENDRAEIRTTFLLTALTLHTHTRTYEENDGKNQQWALHHRPLFICRSFSRSLIIKREKEKDRRRRKKTWRRENNIYSQTNRTTYAYKCRRHAPREWKEKRRERNRER